MAYRIDYSDDGMVWYPLDPQHDSSVFTDDKDLSAVQTRHYRVFAFNSGGSGPALDGMPAVTDKSDKAGPPHQFDNCKWHSSADADRSDLGCA